MHLVLGTPDPVALHLIELLLEQGEVVATLGPGELKRLVPDGVELIVGDAAAIDFGLAGSDYLALAERVATLSLADATPVSYGDVERSRPVRQAAEVCEFVKAGGAKAGVRFLSSLLVFGNASSVVSEDELQVGQGFRDEYEESLAVAEKLVQSLQGSCPLGIVRVAPVVGRRATAELLPDAALAHVARELEGASSEKSYAFSDLPIRFETVERAAQTLVRTEPTIAPRVIHLADDEPLTDRQLIEWLAARLGKTITESPPGARTWTLFAKSSYPGSRAVSGWGLRFDRKNAESVVPQLLDRDDWATLEDLFPPPSGGEA